MIQKDGTVVNPVVEECTEPGYGFEAAAMAAVKRWRYAPARVNDKIRAVYFHLVVDFVMK